MKLTPEQIDSNLAAYRHAMETEGVEDIEFFENRKWQSKANTMFHLFHIDSIYRIRPAKKPRPWTREEFPRDAWFRFKGDGAEYQCARIEFDGVQINRSFHKFDNLLIVIEHSTDGGRTWKPCGVEE